MLEHEQARGKTDENCDQLIQDPYLRAWLRGGDFGTVRIPLGSVNDVYFVVELPASAALHRCGDPPQTAAECAA